MADMLYKILTGEELQKKEDEVYSDIILDSQKKEEFRNELYNYFKNKNIAEDQRFFTSYWRWCVDLTWDNLNACETSDIASFVVFRQSAMALLLDIDIWDRILWYLGLRSLDRQNMGTIYSNIKTNFFSSNAVLGTFQGKSVTISEIVIQYQIFQSRPSESLEKAEFFSKIKSVIDSNKAILEPYVIINSEKILDRLIGLMNFFIGVEADKISFVVDAYINPVEYDRRFQPFEEESVSTEENNFETIQNNDGEDFDQNTENIEESPNIPSLVDAKFEKDETGQYKDIEGVFAYLDELATQMNDDSIREMLYFDETTGGFVWKEEGLPNNIEENKLES